MSDYLIPTEANIADYDLTDAFEYETYHDFTYKVRVDDERISGYVDQLEAYKQAVYKILNTERYEYIIYGWNYGVELKDLFGMPIPYVVPELERRIKEAIEADDRTSSVTDFSFDISKRGTVGVSFKATSVYGSIDLQFDYQYI